MTSIAPNWTDLTGEIVEVHPFENRGKVAATVTVRQAADVDGFRNMLQDRIGEKLSVVMPESVAQNAGIAVGRILAARVKRGREPTLVFAHTRHVTVRNAL